jgi:hypothetical protein
MALRMSQISPVKGLHRAAPWFPEGFTHLRSTCPVPHTPAHGGFGLAWVRPLGSLDTDSMGRDWPSLDPERGDQLASIKHVVLVGHGASDPDVIEYALNEPSRVRHLVLLNTYYGRAPMVRFPELIRLLADRDFAPLAEAMIDDPVACIRTWEGAIPGGRPRCVQSPGCWLGSG